LVHPEELKTKSVHWGKEVRYHIPKPSRNESDDGYAIYLCIIGSLNERGKMKVQISSLQKSEIALGILFLRTTIHISSFCLLSQE
jgi:hypothetical protein